VSHTTEQHECWNCGKHPPSQKAARSLFCQFCNSLQAPSPDYYRFFGLPKALAIDGENLQRTFYQMSRLLHPDRYGRRPERERSYSLEATAILNDGYRVLKDPVRRAEYILNENGFQVGEQRSSEVPPELLEEVFEFNMMLDELKSGDDGVIAQLDESRGRFLVMLDSLDNELDSAFHAHDDASEGEARLQTLTTIRAILHRRRYIQNLVREVDSQLSSRNA
jgi:molecular chaperone HscB